MELGGVARNVWVRSLARSHVVDDGLEPSVDLVGYLCSVVVNDDCNESIEHQRLEQTSTLWTIWRLSIIRIELGLLHAFHLSDLALAVVDWQVCLSIQILVLEDQVASEA